MEKLKKPYFIFYSRNFSLNKESNVLTEVAILSTRIKNFRRFCSKSKSELFPHLHSILSKKPRFFVLGKMHFSYIFCLEFKKLVAITIMHLSSVFPFLLGIVPFRSPFPFFLKNGTEERNGTISVLGGTER